MQAKQPLMQLLKLSPVLEDEPLAHGWPQVLERYREFPTLERMVWASLTESQKKIIKRLR